MKFAKGNWVRLLTWSLLLALAVMSLVWVQHRERQEMERLHPRLREIRLSQQNQEPLANEARTEMAKRLGDGKASVPSTNRPVVTKRDEMSAEERTKLAKDFQEKYLPAAQKWLQAYEGRIPFKLEELTLDKFHSRVFKDDYTFMIGDTTLTIQDSPKNGLKVSYLMTRKEAMQMNNPPRPGFVPDMSVPVTREDIIRMVKADSRVEFKPNEILIKPTAASCALNGGAFVDILPTGKDPNNALNYKISMVFAADGKMVNYERDPRF